jgi:hypothetical protein
MTASPKFTTHVEKHSHGDDGDWTYMVLYVNGKSYISELFGNAPGADYATTRNGLIRTAETRLANFPEEMPK